MAITLAEAESRIIVLEQKLLNAVTIPDYAIEINHSAVEVGDIVMGSKAGINSGNFVIGTVLTAPPTADAHITQHYP